jgi:hypothetical protein
VERSARSQAPAERSKKSPAIAGFFTADKKPDKPKNIFRFHGQLGKFLGEQQRYRSQIVVLGDKSSSKSELVKQIIDGLIDLGMVGALIDYENGDLRNKDLEAGIERNIKPGNRKHLTIAPDDYPRTKEAIKELGAKFDFVAIDSGSKVDEITNEWLDELRTEYPDTVWIILMHKNSKGTTKGGTAAAYNAPVVIFTFKPNATHHKDNYAALDKNRGNPLDVWYLITQKKCVTRDPGTALNEASEEPKKKAA